jgi:hypothetical protein
MSSGSTVTFETDYMPREFERAYFQVSFFTDADLTNPATPTGGTVTVQGSMDDQLVWRSISDSPYNAADAYLETRPIPAASGPMVKARVSFASVTGAAYAKAAVVRY